MSETGIGYCTEPPVTGTAPTADYRFDLTVHRAGDLWSATAVRRGSASVSGITPGAQDGMLDWLLFWLRTQVQPPAAKPPPTPRRFRSRSSVEAAQFDGTNGDAIIRWTDGRAQHSATVFGEAALILGLSCVRVDDWVVKKPDGRFIAYSPSAFADEFESAQSGDAPERSASDH